MIGTRVGLKAGIIEGLRIGVGNDEIAPNGYRGTVDALKGWARPANAVEWTDLLRGTGLPNPNSAWPCTETSGSLADVIGSTALVASGFPLYSQAATGWAGTGVAFSDSSSGRFAMPAGVGPDPDTTSQVWMVVVTVNVEPAAARYIAGVNLTSTTECLRIGFNGTSFNRLRLLVGGGATNSSADHDTGMSYVLFLRYDRAASVVAASSDLGTATGFYSSTVLADGDKGLGGQANTAASIPIMYCALWTGANAELLDDTAQATIRSRIESP